MNEVKNPKKPVYYYYAIVIIAIFLFNALLMPMIAKQAIKEVDYGTFMKMTYDQEIGQVEIQDNQILFTDKEETTIYKTAPVQDPELTKRLYENGAQFAGEIVEEMSPLMSFFMGWIFPIAMPLKIFFPTFVSIAILLQILFEEFLHFDYCYILVSSFHTDGNSLTFYNT